MGRGRHRHHGCANAFLGLAKTYVQSSEISDHLGCGVPHVKCCLPNSPPPNQEGVKMVCENQNCPYDIELIHTECFSKLEEILVDKMRITGCGRGWCRKKCQTNLWKKKGIHLVADCLKCRCGKGRIVYEENIKPQIVSRSFNAKSEEKMPKRDFALKRQPKENTQLIVSRVTKDHKSYYQFIVPDIEEQSSAGYDTSSEYDSVDDYGYAVTNPQSTALFDFSNLAISPKDTYSSQQNVIRWFAAHKSNIQENLRANEPSQKRIYHYLFSIGSNGYVSAEQGDVGPLTANGNKINETTSFLLIRNADGTVSLKSKANEKFVSIDDFQGGKLIPESDNVSLRSKFKLELQKEDYCPFVAIKSVANGKYVTSQSIGKTLMANKSTIGKWETFKFGVIETRH